MNTLITRPPRQAIAQPQGETRILVPNASWTLYESFVMKLPERSPIRTAFDGRDMEIMVKGGSTITSPSYLACSSWRWRANLGFASSLKERRPGYVPRLNEASKQTNAITLIRRR